MAKRFTDTDKWKRPWYRNLPPAMRELWSYILDNCDHAGVWVEDLQGASLLLALPLTRTDYETFLGPKFVRVAPDKVFIPSFIEFQYGSLNESNRAHRSVINLLARLNINPSTLEKEAPSKPLVSPSQGAKDKDKDQDKDKDKEKGGVGENISVTHSLASDHVRACGETWFGTLAHFKQPRTFLLPPEALAIARSIQENGAEATDLALYGARHEPAHEGWDPRAHVDITRVLCRDKDGKHRIQKFVGFGVAARAKKSHVATEPKPDDRRSHAHADIDCPLCRNHLDACTCGEEEVA